MDLPLVEELGIEVAADLREETVRAPSAGVRRILDAAGVHPSDTEAFWLGVHMEGFVSYARRHCELLELPLAVESYLTWIKRGRKDWPAQRRAQLSQALILFQRGIEAWRWVRSEELTGPNVFPVGPQGWVLRYRVRASGVVHPGAISGSSKDISPAGPSAAMEDWLERLKRALRFGHYSLRTEQAYLDVVRRFLLFSGPVR